MIFCDYYFNSWQFMKTMTINKSPCLPLTIHDTSSWFMTNNEDSQMCDSLWQLSTILRSHEKSYQFMTSYDKSWWFMAIHKQITIYNTSWQIIKMHDNT